MFIRVSKPGSPHSFGDYLSTYGLSATVPRQVEVWLAKNDEGDTCRFFYSRGKAIGTKPSDWEKVDSKLFSKKRLVYKKNDHNVWAMVSRLGD